MQREYFVSPTDDISIKKIATQMHTYTGSVQLYDANNAVDRTKSTCMRTNPLGPNSPDKTVWWKVDLGRMYNIYNINILFKNYDGYGNYFIKKIRFNLYLGIKRRLCML